MNNLQVGKLALSITAVLALVSCSIFSSPASKPKPLPANPQEFFATNGVATQTKSITVGGSSVKVTFSQGTSLTFGPDSVVDSSGAIYTGVVELGVREITSKSDMILSNVLTISNESPLVSGGMFFLELKTPAGAALNVNPAKGVAVAVPLKDKPGAANDRMQQFFGSQTKCGKEVPNGGTVTPAIPIDPKDSSVNWCPVAGKFGIDNTTPPGSYVFSVFNKGWINCDFFYNDLRAKTTLRVTFDPIDDENTMVFMIPKGINTVIAVYTKDGTNKRKSYDNSIPVGLETELVALTFHDGKQYLAHKTLVVSANMTENLIFAEASTKEIQDYLSLHN
jgi:hypothetical protein